MALERMRIDGKVAVITGIGRGVGKSIATVFSEAGAKIVGCARSQDQLDETVKELNASGGEATGIIADVMKSADLQRLTDTAIERYGRIDILVNNAGGMDFRAFLDIPEEEFKFTFDWNTTSPFVLSQMVARHMLKQGSGAILNVSSGAARFGIRGMMSYCVAKAGTEQLTRALAQELAPKIRVNCVALGAVMTPALQRTFDMEAGFKDKMLDKTPLHAIGDAEEVGLASLFLCSPAASYITGTILGIDGGLQDTNLPFRLPDL